MGKRAFPFFLICLVTGLLCSSACKEGEVDLDFDDDDAGFYDAAIADGGDSGTDIGPGADSAAPPGDDAGVEPDAAEPEPPSSEDLAYVLGEAICAALEACQGAELLAQSMDGQSCVDKIGGVFANRNLVYLQDAIDADRVIFEPDNLAQCATDMAARGCEVKSSRWRQVCSSTVQGTVAAGGECALDEECEGDAFCDRGADGTDCPGACTALKAEDEQCANSDQCEDGLVCFGGSCAAPLTTGDACDTAPALCRTGLICLDGTCQTQETLYAADTDQECDPALDDLLDVLCRVDGDEPLVCVEQDSGPALCQTRVGPSETCRRAKPSQCPLDQYCDAEPNQEGTCVDLPGLYDDCRSADFEQRCASGLICDAYRGSEACVPINDNGRACESDAACYSGTCGEDYNCAPPEACSL